MDKLDYETVETWEPDGRHVSRIITYDPPATDTTLIATSDLIALRADVERLRAREADGPPSEGVHPTPAEWIYLWNRATPEQRLERAHIVLDNAAAAERCRMSAHAVDLERLTELNTLIGEVLDLHPSREQVASGRYQSKRLCPSCITPAPCETRRILTGQQE